MGPVISDLYRLREEIEDRDKTQTGGLNAVLLALGFNVFTRLNAATDFQQVRPRIELISEIGAATGRRFVCPDGVLRFDAFAFRLGIQAVTVPSNIPADNQEHEDYLANVRAAMSAIGGPESFADTVNFPNVYIAEFLKDAGADAYLKDNEGIEYTTLSYEGIVCIRKSAWSNN